jgi:hypothetical protein
MLKQAVMNTVSTFSCDSSRFLDLLNNNQMPKKNILKCERLPLHVIEGIWQSGEMASWFLNAHSSLVHSMASLSLMKAP